MPRLQRLALLPRPRLMEFVCDLAVILNTTPYEIAIEVAGGNEEAYFSMSAGDTASEGCIGENGTVTAVLRDGKRIASRPLIPSDASLLLQSASEGILLPCDREKRHLSFAFRSQRLETLSIAG